MDVVTKKILGKPNPSIGSTDTVMGYNKLIYNQIGQDDPVLADRTNVMNYLKLIEETGSNPAPYTPGIRAMGLDVGATNIGNKIVSNVLSINAVSLSGFGNAVSGAETLIGPSYANTRQSFNLGLQGTITSLSHTVYYNSHNVSWTPYDDGFTCDIYTDNAGALGSLVASKTIAGTLPVTAGSTYTFDFTGLSLVGTNKYWFVYTVATIGSGYIGIKTSGSTVWSYGNYFGIAGSVQMLLTPTVDYSHGYLLKSLTRLNLDRLAFPKIYKPANTKCQVDILGASIRANTATGGATDYITLDASASAVDDFYNGNTVILRTGTGAGQRRVIVDYIGATKRAYVTGDLLTTAPVNGTTFEIFQTIQSDISPGYDFSTIDYTTYPTVNVICSLEKQAGATASPSMGVPITTSIEKDWVSQAPVISRSTSSTYITALSATGRRKLDGITLLQGATDATNSAPVVKVTVDGAVLPGFDGLTFPVGSFSNMYGLYIPLDIACETSLLVEHKTSGTGAGGSCLAIGNSK